MYNSETSNKKMFSNFKSVNYTNNGHWRALGRIKDFKTGGATYNIFNVLKLALLFSKKGGHVLPAP